MRATLAFALSSSYHAGEEQHRMSDQRPVNEPPPFGRSWTVLYAAVLINLAVLILLFYLFTKVFE